MQKNRTIFIGDIHGCYKELKLLLNKLNLQENDKIYFTGDLINGGPKSFKVLRFLYKNKDKFKSVIGNNDLGFLDWYKNGDKNYNHQYSIDIFKKLKNKIKEKNAYYLIDYLKNLPLYIEKENFILLHAGITPGKEIENHTKEEITNIREIDSKPWYKYYKGEKIIIYGHFARDGLEIREKTKGLDSGCVYGKWLTAFILETGEIYSQTALDCYIDLYKKLKGKSKN